MEQEFRIEKQNKRIGLEPKNDKRYIPMFEIENDWFFALPVVNYSLMTIGQCKNHITKMQNIKGMSKNYKIAEFQQ
jgi:hypothetical protein